MFLTTIIRDSAHNCWYRYRDPIDMLMASSVDEVRAILCEVEQRVEQEHIFAAGFATYEAAPGFDAKLRTHSPGRLPPMCFTLYAMRERLDELPDCSESSLSEWQLSIDEQSYERQIKNLQKQIEAGDFYQVNFTDRLMADGVVNLGTFKRIAAQAPYGAFIQAETFTIASASPELFFSRDKDRILCQPMKGTASRGRSSADDARAAAWLQSSTKNRAENLMITDMVRNDLGRVARVGSVQVPAKFHVTQFPTVWQMTSDVVAVSDAPLADLFGALYPAASITGAPKCASMKCITQVEATPREIYTGTIGVIAPGRQASFSVAIRTLWSDTPHNESHYGAGGGIVWDSQPADEYQELKAKTQILHTQVQTFSLLETMRWSPQEGYFLCSDHLQRLADSARYFVFVCDVATIEARMHEFAATLAPQAHKVRMVMNKYGEVEFSATALVLDECDTRLSLAPTPVSTQNVMLYHKTTDRRVYERASDQCAEDHEALLMNEDGYITESVIANVVYELAGELFTPPVHDGLLPGTLRQALLREGKIQERSIHVRDLYKPSAWYLVNALRGWRRACIPDQDANGNAGG